MGASLALFAITVLRNPCNYGWLLLMTAGKGHVSNNPGRHCLDILNSGEFKETE